MRTLANPRRRHRRLRFDARRRAEERRPVRRLDVVVAIEEASGVEEGVWVAVEDALLRGDLDEEEAP